MSSDTTSKRTQPQLSVGEPDARAEDSLRFWLEYRGHRVELRQGSTFIGRATSCQLVLDDVLVSRKHARIDVSGERASLEDLGSANGVFINSARISGPVELTSGDHILVGKQEMIVRAAVQKSLGDSASHRFMAETLHGLDARVDIPGHAEYRERDHDDATRRGDALELLGGVADKVLALGRGDEAEKILSSALGSLMAAVLDGKTPNNRLLELGAGYAIKLAEATKKPRWVDYAFDLYNVLERPLPTAVVDQLYTLLRKLPGVNLSGLRDYVATLRRAQGQFGPTERFLVQRIEGLERLAGLK